MKLNLVRPFVFIDLETTGTDIVNDRIVQIAILKVFPDGSEIVLTENINPTVPIPLSASQIHGIYDYHVNKSPTFSQLAQKILTFVGDSDIAGFNSHRFDVPLLLEEFCRAKVDFNLEGRNLVDVQTIFHKMEPRNLQAAYRFYCDKELINAHNAESDIRATYEVLKAQIEYYTKIEFKDKQGNISYPIENNVESLAQFTPFEIIDPTRRVIHNEDKKEIFNFGKHKGKRLTEVFAEEPTYYHWMMEQNFSCSTRMIIKKIWEEMNNK